MPLDPSLNLEIIEVVKNFLLQRRPSEEIRPQLDIGYRIGGQSVFVLEIRPQWNNPEVIREFPLAKANFVKAQGHWKIFWMRSDLKWYSYEPKSNVKTIREFSRILDEDKFHCFLSGYNAVYTTLIIRNNHLEN